MSKVKWNYRVIRAAHKLGEKTFYDYSVHTVYYEGDEMVSWSEEPTYLSAMDSETLVFDLEAFHTALRKPVLIIVDGKLEEIDEIIVNEK